MTSSYGICRFSKNIIKNEEYEFDKIRTKKHKLQIDERRENKVHMNGRQKLKA